MASVSCSTTITVLPRSRKCLSVVSRRSLSRWCSPIEGSSRTYMTPACPVALGARLGVEVFCELLAHHHRVGFPVAALEVGDDALEGVLAHRRLAAVREVLERDFLLLAAVENHLLHALGQLVEGALQ